MAADKLIRRYKTNDPRKIAEAKNINIIYEPLGSTLGYYSTYKRINFIHINSSLNSIWQRFVCAHELGHAILHPKVNTPFLRSNTLFSVQRIEREANEFAVELLMPDVTFRAYENRSRSIYEIAARHGIPEELISLKKLIE
ncbi:ImmA/IrrE family metallo-endopeptidase [Desulfosporosinus sp. PR]|uniref:ImmA/IrrE family metallo-endopeptidase n=1 Tax=Candidatus Desulfosporosinus nitrosoreducens TaxID=3401928 RepID=UPI0027EA5D1E|nr:ImmA/IrrE family metallo-endopeptidase [Desulfosporosinus sp. PR]MDQ7094169.1 ImmA/IrrE family metallo-endopeptidase [Desulfosporosinus sp. PR]